MNKKNVPPIIRRTAEITVITALYYLTAQLGFMIALPPGNVTALWIPSGLALASVYIWGWQIGIGIFIGSFLANLGTMSGTIAPPVSAAIAAGSTLQAWLGVWALKRFIEIIPPNTIRKTLLSILIISTTTLLASSIGVTSLCLAGFAQWNNFFMLATTWWLGDLIGILVFAPTAIVLFMRWNKQKVNEVFLWPLTCLLIGLSLFSFFIIENGKKYQINNSLQNDTREITQILQDMINHDIKSLIAVGAYYTSSQDMNKQEFLLFTTPLLANSSTTTALSWVPRVTQAERTNYERNIQEQGAADFHIYEKDASGNNITAGTRAEYFSVTFIEPLASNKTAVGFDIASNPARLKTIAQARDSGEAAATAPIHLVQESGDQLGILVMMPVYRLGAPLDTVEDRRANLAGLANGALRINAVVDRAFQSINSKDIESYFYDIGDVNNPQFLTFYPSTSGVQSLPAGKVPTLADLQTGTYQTKIFQVGGRDWLIVTRPGPRYASTFNNWLSWVSLLAGFTLTAGFLFYVNTRQKIETDLARSESEFRTLSEYALTGVARYELSTGNILYINSSAAQMFGFDSSEEIIHKNLLPYISDRTQIEALVKTLQSSGQVRDQIVEILTAQGAKREMLCSASLHKDTVNVTFMDVTERIRAEKEIGQLSRIVSQMADLVIITDIKGVIEYVNPAFEKLTGYTRSEVIGKTPSISKSGLESREFYLRLWETILRGEVFQGDIRNRKKNGELYYESRTITPIRDAAGTIINFVATGQDVTERKQVEKSLHESEERFRGVFESSNAIMLMIEPDSGMIVDANPTASEFYGYSHEQLNSMNINDINYLPPDEVAVERQNAKTEKRNYFIFPHKLANGEIRTVEVRSHPIKTKGQTLLFSLVYDITERRQIEEALNESKLLFHLLIESLPQNIYAKDIEGRFIFANAHYCATAGRLLEEIIGKTDFDLHPVELAEKYREDDRRVLETGTTLEMEEEHASINKENFFVQVIKAPFYDSKEQKAGTLGIFWDITERKRSEALLRQQSEQMRLLYKASQRLNRTLNLQDIYETICDFMSIVAPNDGVVISAFDQTTQLITCRAYWLDDKWLDVSSFPSIPLEEEGKGTQSIVIRTGQAMLINDFQARVKSAQSNYYVNSETNEVDTQVSEDEEITQSAMIVPLKTGDVVNGVIQVTSYKVNAYTESQLKILEALSVHIVSAEKNAMLYAQVQAELNERKQAETLQKTVYQIAEAAQLSQSLQDLYPQIHSQISNIMYADNFYIALYDAASGLLRFAYFVDEMDTLTTEPMQLGKGLTDYVLQTGKSLLCDDRKKEELKAKGEYESSGAASAIWLGVPLITHGKTIGVMAAQHYSDAHAFTEREQQILEFVSSQVATAIDRKQTEENVRMIEKRNKVIIENAPDGIVLQDIEGKIIYSSPSADQILGFAEGELLGQRTIERVHSDDLRLILQTRAEILRDPSKIYTVQFRFLRKDESYRWLESIYSNLLAEPGVNAMVINFRDITEQKQATEMLRKSQVELEELNRDLEKRVEERTAEVRQSEAIYRALFENSNDGIFLISSEGEDLNANQQALNMLGYTLEEYQQLTQGNINVIASPEQHADANARFAQALSGDYMPLYERTLVGKNGKRIEVEINLSAVRDQSGKIIMVQSVVRDITERKRAEKLLRESSEMFSQFMRYSPIFTFVKEVTPTEDKVLYASENFIEMVGIPGSQMVGKTMSDLFSPEFAKKIIADDWAAISSHEVIKLDEELNGRSYTSIKFPIFQGDKTLLAGYSIDITERKQAEEALLENRDKLSVANAALEKASRLKDEFLASMSHELRTPLTGILGLSEALQLQTYGALTEKQLKSIKNIEISGRHLLELINDILDLSKIEAGKLDMQFEPCSVADICQASLHLTKGMAYQKSINISLSMNPASISIRADSRRLKQMLVNLLSNAIKFTPEGGKVGLDVQGNNNEKAVLISIWDKGIGIKPEEMEKLFKPFTQIDSSLARQYSGTGLGLSLVQRMAELHGGSVKVESAPGEGSVFTIALPWSENTTQPVSNDKKMDTGPLKNTLIIEDNHLDVEHVTRYLKEIGIASIVQSVMNGAMEKAATLQPSVIILDLNLPDGFGLDLLAQLKADERTRSIPVIITSVEERRAEAMKIGAIGYLIKPFGQQELRTELEKAAAFNTSTDAVMVIGSRDSAPLVLIADDNEMIIELITDYMDSKGYRVVATRSGFELLQRAPELHPDIMLVDIQMPGMDGMETIRRVRAHSDPKFASTPMIAVTALAMSGDREKCLEAGANEYMSKPIVLTQLTEQIQKILKKAGVKS